MWLVGLLIFISGPIANKYLFNIDIVDKICRYGFIILIVSACVTFMIMILANKGIKNMICKYEVLRSIESNLMSIGAYTKLEDKVFVVLPKIKIK
ncbi:MAG: hypothetical protein E7258_09830, partial [Lachnospiraceae bacterium]|nr:hypothetical protein [Lachnospiraceae bacterium]